MRLCRLLLIALFGLFVLPLPPLAAQAGCENAPPPRLVSGGRARVSIGAEATLRLRAAAGTSAAQIASLNGGAQLAVLPAEPICADGLRWWQVETAEGLRGWLAEGAGADYFLAPLRVDAPPNPADADCSEALPATATTGDRITVNQLGQPVDAYLLPSAAAGFHSRWWAGHTFVVEGGPSCGGGAWWYRVRLPDNALAWIMIGDRAQYYFDLQRPTATPGPTLTPTASPMPSPTLTPTPSAAPTATNTGTPRPTLTPRATLTPTPTVDTACYSAPLPRLRAGDTAEVVPLIGNLRLRTLPNADTGVVAELFQGNRFTVVGGPSCNGGYYWYRVQLADGVTSGWVAEGVPGQYWLRPYGYVYPTASERA